MPALSSLILLDPHPLLIRIALAGGEADGQDAFDFRELDWVRSKAAASAHSAANPEFGRRRDLGAPAWVLRQEFSDQDLADSFAIDVGRVPEIDAELQRTRQRAPCAAFALSANRSGRPIALK